jgi:hypothetical protein
MHKPSLVWAAVISSGFLLASCGSKPTASNSQAAPPSAGKVDYSPRIGTAVRTDSRACIAIQNATVAPNSPVTLINPAAPQTFAEAQISAQASNACPITQNIPPGIVSYDVSLPASANIPKLTPLIAVLGTAASSTTTIANNGVIADLDNTHTKNTFRACGANDGVHLTVWRSDPLAGTLLWTGTYYEPGNPGTLPTCTAAEGVTVP